MRIAFVLLSLILFSSCSSHDAASPSASSGLSSAPAPAAYLPRVGIAVITGSRTCVAIQNANLTVSSPVTLVSPIAPQTFLQAEIAALSASPCPITKDVDPTVSNYDLHIPKGGTLPKLTPLIAVTGTSAVFSTAANSSVVADLNQNNKAEAFRACAAPDGIHLTLWPGNALDGTLLWHGYYYEPGNAAVGPACTPKEMPPA